jgi:predicted DNA-binding transcriptional regulator AlpA
MVKGAKPPSVRPILTSLAGVDPNIILTIEDLQAILGLSGEGVRRWVRDGRLPRQIGPARWLAGSVLDWFKQASAQGPQDTPPQPARRRTRAVKAVQEEPFMAVHDHGHVDQPKNDGIRAEPCGSVSEHAGVDTSPPGNQRQRVRITPAMKANIIELLHAGMPQSKIAVQVGCSQAAVSKINLAHKAPGGPQEA